MKNKSLIILGMIIITIAVILDSIAPIEIDWQKSYHENKKKPFDLKVFHDQLDTIYHDYEIKTIKTTFYEHQENRPLSFHNGLHKIYLNIDENFHPDPSSEEKLLEFVAKGNNAFISANHFSTSLLDSLHISKNIKQNTVESKDSLIISLSNTDEKLSYIPKLKYSQTYFKDSTNIYTIGKVKLITNDSLKNSTNFIKVKYSRGTFYLHTQPEIFTNYELLKSPNTAYINQLLSIISKKSDSETLEGDSSTILNHKYIYFESNFKANAELINSPLRFIKSQKELNLAWKLILIGFGLFFIINSKRKQRVIPVIPKVKNTSLEFVETIATLYEDSDNFQPIIKQKIHVFYRSIRNKHNITTDKTNTKLAYQLSKKSGYELVKTKELIRFINAIKTRETSSITLLTKLNKEIENFYKNTNAWKN